MIIEMDHFHVMKYDSKAKEILAWVMSFRCLEAE